MDNNNNKDRSISSCIPIDTKENEIKPKGKFVSDKKFIKSIDLIDENTKGGKFVDQNKLPKSDIFHLSGDRSNNSNNLFPNLKAKNNILDIKDSKRKSARPDFIKNPFVSQISSFH